MRVLVECFADKALVDIMNISNMIVEHAHGKENICRKLSKETGLIGLMDEDPEANQHSYLQQLFQFSEPIITHGLIVLEDLHRKNRLILFRPRLEEWILRIAHQTRISPSRYGLPTNPDALHQKNIRYLNNRKKFLQALFKESIPLRFFKVD